MKIFGELELSKSLILADEPLAGFLEEMFEPDCQCGSWSLIKNGSEMDLEKVKGLYLYGHPIVDGALMDCLPNLKIVSNFGVGIDHVDVQAASERGVAVGNTPGAVEGATADMTMALLLATARNIVVGDSFARSNEFQHYDPNRFVGHEVHGSTLGIVGLGRIGTEVARRAKGFGMKILYYNRRRNSEIEQELAVEYVSLEELLHRAHFVTLNVPMTNQTRHMIGETELRSMREDGILINIARGGVVDHEALYKALKERWIVAAAIDVTEPEPLDRKHPLLSLKNLVITPHLGSATFKTRKRMGEMAIANIRAALKNLPLPFAVKPT